MHLGGMLKLQNTNGYLLVCFPVSLVSFFYVSPYLHHGDISGLDDYSLPVIVEKADKDELGKRKLNFRLLRTV